MERRDSADTERRSRIAQTIYEASDCVGRGWTVVPVAPPIVNSLRRSGSLDVLGGEPIPIPGVVGIRDVARVYTFWQRDPLAQFAVRTGPCGPVVIVVRPSDSSSSDDIVERLARRPDVVTSNGEAHFYFRGGDVPTAVLGPRVELRGANGLVLCPPSRDLWGAPYQWAVPRLSLPELPRWVVDLAVINLREDSSTVSGGGASQ